MHWFFWSIALVTTPQSLTQQSAPKPSPIPFIGNRTHFPNKLPRPDAKTADPNFLVNGKGIVNILNPYSRSIANNTRALQQQRSIWASQNNVRLLYRTYNEAETYDDYIEQVALACNFSETTSFDVLWINSTMTGYLSDCLLDLYAWDFDMAKGFEKSHLENVVIKDKLVALPSESSLGVMIKNVDILNQYNFNNNPKSLDEIEQICSSILRSERTQENWKLSCITGPFSTIDEVALMATQWIASNNASIFKNSSITIASSQAADVLARISSWSNTGIVDAIDFKSANLETSMQRFKEGHSIFLLGNLAQYNALHRDPPKFEWGLAPFPGENDRFFGVLGGWNLGVYKFSKNPAAAVKAIKWITSSEAQKESILLSEPIKLLPTRSELYADAEVCNSIGESLCDEFGKVQPVVPPTIVAGRNHWKVLNLIGSTVYDILNDNVDVKSGLETLYLSLRSTLNLNGTFTKIDGPVRPVKKGFAYLTLQVWILLVFGSSFITLAVGFRLWYAYQVRKQKAQEEEEQALDKKALEETKQAEKEQEIEMVSVVGGPYKFQRLDDEEFNDDNMTQQKQ